MSKNTDVSSGQQPSLVVDQDNVYDIICEHFPSEWHGFYLSKQNIKCALEDLTARGVISVPFTGKEEWLTNKRKPRHGVAADLSFGGKLLFGSNDYVSSFKLDEPTQGKFLLNSGIPKARARNWVILLPNC